MGNEGQFFLKSIHGTFLRHSVDGSLVDMTLNNETCAQWYIHQFAGMVSQTNSQQIEY